MHKLSRIVVFILLHLAGINSFSQGKYTIGGYIRDSLSGEALIGASVSIQNQGYGIISNHYGYYALTLPEGRYTVNISFAGYLSKEINLDLTNNYDLNVNLLPQSLMEEVVITSTRGDKNVTLSQMGKIDLSIARIKSAPVLLGETDILKTLQLLPGVRNAGEGNTGLYIRGGGADQNLILLDDAIVYNTGHLFGFFSIFNSDAIKNVSLIKGSMPAQYGGRLSSVLDISMKEGNLKRFEAEGGLGLIASRLSLQGPIKKDKASFIISARRTYLDVLTKPLISNSNYQGSGYYFYDLNAKMNYIFSDKNRIYLSGYFGRDVFDFASSKQSFKANIPWGNATASLRWNHVFNKKLFANTALVYNDYKFSFSAIQHDAAIRLSSGIKDLSGKLDFDYYPAPQHKFKFGGQLTHHRFTPNVLSGHQGQVLLEPDNDSKKFAYQTALYIEDNWEIAEKFSVNAGLRYSSFSQTGPYTLFQRDEDGNKLDSVVYGKGDRIKTYAGLEPRFSFRYSLDESTSFKAGVARNRQYIHLVSNAGSTLPTDLWMPSSYRVGPQLSWQYSAGLFRNFRDNQYETSIELYYKDMQNQIEYGEGYSPSLKDTEENFVFGRGWSYGSELFINKSSGKFSGWLGYTISWTWRRFRQLNEGLKYPAKYDRRHDLSIMGAYELNERWKLSTVFVYGSGNAVTIPERFYIIEQTLTQEYGKINQHRLPAYHRLDISAIYTPKLKPGKKNRQSWVFSLYNVYSRQNPYFIYFNQEGNMYDGSLNVEARQVSLFPLIPSVTWNFKL